MANTVQLKRSSVAGRVPNAANVAVGEPVVNLVDRVVYTKDGSGNIVQIAGGNLQSLADVSNATPSNNQVLAWNGTEWTPTDPAAASGSSVAGVYGNVSNAQLAAGIVASGLLTTDNVTEATNLYFTNSRVYSNVTQLGYITSSALSGYATNGQLSVYATNAQLSVYATNTQLSVYATNAQLSSYATTAQLDGYATNSQLALYATNTQLAAYATNAQLASYATNAQLTVYATNAQLASYATNSQLALYATNSQLASYATVSNLTAAYNQANAAYNSSNTKVATVVGVTGTSISNTNILDGIKTVDGTGSGLDADLLDGLQATAFAKTTDLTTANVTEVSNLYFTNARVYANVIAGNFTTKTYVDNSIANLISSAPATLDTLNELAAALGDDPNFATTTANLVGEARNQANAAYNQANTAITNASTATTIATAAFNSSNTKVATVAGVTSTAISNTNILDGIKTVDGAGSGLDADLLDGLQATAFAKTTDLTTANVAELTNLYFTTARARTSLSQGSGISYNSSTGVISANVTSVAGRTGAVTLTNTDITGLTTANVTELTNLYFTNARSYANIIQLGYITSSALNGYATNAQLTSYATTANLTLAFNQANTATTIATAAFDSGNTKVATVAGVTATAISNANLLDGIKAVDGVGSGLDADLLDGLSGGGAGAYALKANNLSVFATTTSAQLAGIISDETGTGSLVFNRAPSFTGTVLFSTVGSNTTPAVRVSDELNRSINFLANVSQGSYNGLVTTNDSLIYFTAGNGNNTGNLVIAPWSSTNTGIKIASLSNSIILSAATTTISGNTTACTFTASTVTSAGNVSGNTFYITKSNDYITYTTEIDSWKYANVFSVAAQETEPRDIEFSADGTKMFILGNAGNDITEYNLGTAWAITSAVAGNVYSVGTQEGTPTGLYFKPDGTRFYVVGSNDVVYSYDLSSAWNITTASYVNSFSVTAQETDAQAISFSTDGTKMYILGTVGDDVNQYNLGTAWDITTAVYSTVYSVATYEPTPQGLFFNSTGTKFWIVGTSYTRVVEYNLSTPWSISTASFSGYVNVGLLSTYAVLGVSGIYVNPAQNKAWITDYQNDAVFELALDIPAAKLYGSKWIVNPDLHLQNDLIVERNTKINGSLYMPGFASFGNLDVTGTLNVRAALDLADDDILRLGSSDDIEFYHSSASSNNFIDITTGDLLIRDDATAGDPTRFTFERATGNFTASGNVNILNGGLKFPDGTYQTTAFNNFSISNTISSANTLILSFSSVEYRGGKLILTSNSGSVLKIQEVLVLHNGTTVQCSQNYLDDNELTFGNLGMTFTGNILSGIVRIYGTASTGTPVVKGFAQLIST